MSLKVSQLLDGQLETEVIKTTLDEILGDVGQRDRLTIYGLVGDALRGNPTPDDGFTKRLLERMEREAVKIEPGYDPLAEN